MVQGIRDIRIISAVLAILVLLSGCSARKSVIALYQSRTLMKPRAVASAQKMGYAI